MKWIIEHIEASFPRLIKSEKYGDDMITSRVICLQDARINIASALEAIDLELAKQSEKMRNQGRKI